MSELFKIGFLGVTWVDVIDVTLVALLLFQFYKLLKGSMAAKIFVGLLVIYALYLVVKAIEMPLLTSILGEFTGIGVLAAFILFQQEIRRFLLLIGRNNLLGQGFWRGFSFRKAIASSELDLMPIIEAVKSMSDTYTGALIVFARVSELKYYVESGDVLDAMINKRLLQSIFNKYSPMHDGAVIIVKGRIKAARCILPVSENEQIPAYMGLRHRAGIGVSEVTDGVAVIVSEETGTISLADGGVIFHNLSPIELHDKLKKVLFEEK